MAKSLTDKEWRSRADADILMQAKEIETDKARMAAAKKVAATEAKRYGQVAAGPSAKKAVARIKK